MKKKSLAYLLYQFVAEYRACGYKNSVMESLAQEYENAEAGKNKWIPWGGGSDPTGNANVYVRLRVGHTTVMVGRDWDWSHTESGSDIVAYKYVRDEK